MRKHSLAGAELNQYHVCAFFDSREEEYSVLGPFFKEGIDQAEKCIHIVNPAQVDDHRRRLSRAGINTHECESCGQLEIVPWNQAYLDENGVFDQTRMLALVDELTGHGRGTDFKAVRIMGNMDWVFQDVPGAEAILEYESAVNTVLARNKQLAICVYDVAKLSGAMLMDLLRTHPLTLIGGVLQENPFYTPPEQMLEELRARKAA